ncbi:cytochrome b/b6 domain-containing protein [Aeromonas finlandensis]|uniref:cytochrome b/b6 domain-containing protein n=1 Tax=Aeromonas finlandensis TaxID=1543375 RepID=UPI00067B52F8
MFFLVKEDEVEKKYEIYVWDVIVRLFHWITVTLCVLNLFILEEGERNHRYVGYTLAGLVVIRIIWGFYGSHYARFYQFIPTPTDIYDYIHNTLNGKHPYYAGHNPVGSLMVLFLLACLVGTAVTGILTNFEDLFGDDVMEGIHGIFAQTLQAAIFVHVLAVIVIDYRTKSDLIRGMITGKKRITDKSIVKDLK